MGRLKWIVIGHKVLVRLLTKTQRGNNVLGRKKYYILSVVEMSMLWFFFTTVQVKVEMALKVENYNYTKELENKSSPQYEAIAKNFTEEVWFLPSFRSLSPHSFFFLPRSSLFAILSKPPSFLFLLPLFFLLFSINSLFPPSFPSQPYLLSLSYLSLFLLLSPPALLSSLSSLPILLPSSFLLPTLHHFSHPLTLSSVLPPSLLFP